MGRGDLHLRCSSRACTITEETPDFITRKAPCGATYLQLFLEGLHQRGHYTAAHLLSTAPATVTRDRVYIVSLTEHLGGQAALDYISGTIDAIQAHMAAATPLDIRTIVGNKTSTQLEQCGGPGTELKRCPGARCSPMSEGSELGGLG